MDKIVSKDPDLVAALGSVCIGMNNMRENFESAVAFMLPACPWSKIQKRKTKDEQPPSISSALKNSNERKRGVDFRWHTSAE